jgi:hypothetical protein
VRIQRKFIFGRKKRAKSCLRTIKNNNTSQVKKKNKKKIKNNNTSQVKKKKRKKKKKKKKKNNNTSQVQGERLHFEAGQPYGGGWSFRQLFAEGQDQVLGLFAGHLKIGEIAILHSNSKHGSKQRCQIFLSTKSQNGKISQNDHKIYQMAIKYSKWQ